MAVNEKLNDYIRGVDDQEIKGVLLKLKNELQKQNPQWEVIRVLIRTLFEKRKDVLFDVLPLILN